VDTQLYTLKLHYKKVTLFSQYNSYTVQKQKVSNKKQVRQQAVDVSSLLVLF